MESEFLTGKVEWLGLCPESTNYLTQSRESLLFSIDHGIKGDHHGFGRFLDARERALLSNGISKGIPLANTRTWTLVSMEEIAEIEKLLNVSEGDIPRGYFGENIAITGVPDVTILDPGTLLLFKNEKGEMRNAVLAVWAENMPCIVPATALADYFDEKSIKIRFGKASLHKRGLVGFVYSGGKISVGDTIIVIPPNTRYG